MCVTAIGSGAIFIPICRAHIINLEAQRAAEDELAVEAGKAKDVANGSSGDDEHAPAERTESGKPALTRTASGRVVSSIQRLGSNVSLAAKSIKESKAGKAIAKNRVFKWISYGAPGAGAWAARTCGLSCSRVRTGSRCRACAWPARLLSRSAHTRTPLPSAGINYDMHAVLDATHAKHNSTAAQIWDNAEVFDWRAETVFKYIQVRARVVQRRRQ